MRKDTASTANGNAAATPNRNAPAGWPGELRADGLSAVEEPIGPRQVWRIDDGGQDGLAGVVKHGLRCAEQKPNDAQQHDGCCADGHCDDESRQQRTTQQIGCPHDLPAVHPVYESSG